MRSYMVDSNALICYLKSSDPQHTAAANAIEGLTERGYILHITARSIIEFWAVTSRPGVVNDFGWDVGRSEASVPLLLASFDFLSGTVAVFTEWHRLMTSKSLIGRQVHDARLMAVMKAHGLSDILILTAGDFQCYTTAPPHGEGSAVVDRTSVPAVPLL
jgi:predicted nucleic acid-binding protein